MERKTPWLAIVAIVVLLGAAVFFTFRFVAGGSRIGTPGWSTQRVTIVDRESGESWTLLNGQIENVLRQRPLPLDVGEGLANPTTGKPTGFPERDWEHIVAWVQADREAIAAGPVSAPAKHGGKK